MPQLPECSCNERRAGFWSYLLNQLTFLVFLIFVLWCLFVFTDTRVEDPQLARSQAWVAERIKEDKLQAIAARELSAPPAPPEYPP